MENTKGRPEARDVSLRIPDSCARAAYGRTLITLPLRHSKQLFAPGSSCSLTSSSSGRIDADGLSSNSAGAQSTGCWNDRALVTVEGDPCGKSQTLGRGWEQRKRKAEGGLQCGG